MQLGTPITIISGGINAVKTVISNCNNPRTPRLQRAKNLQRDARLHPRSEQGQDPHQRRNARAHRALKPHRPPLHRHAAHPGRHVRATQEAEAEIGEVIHCFVSVDLISRKGAKAQSQGKKTSNHRGTWIHMDHPTGICVDLRASVVSTCLGVAPSRLCVR